MNQPITPNPWAPVIYEPDDPDYIGQAIADKLRQRVTDGTAGPTYAVEMPDPENPENRPFTIALVGNGPAGRINAHLIAAAPYLYDLLSDALELSTPCRAATPEAWEQRQKKAREWEGRAIAALAKAVGEEP